MKKKNVVFILADDQGFWTLGCYGNRDARTPTLDRMAAEGVRFENAYCASPVCSPARASILTGKMPSAHGVIDWLSNGNIDRSQFEATRENPHYRGEDRVIRYLQGQTAYTDLLQENGYTCSLVGKWHLGDSLCPQHGFSRWLTVPLGHSVYLDPEICKDGDVKRVPGYVTDILTDRALNEIDALSEAYQCDGKPFYLSLHYTAPHGPWGKKAHEPRIHEMFKDCNFDSVPFEPMHPNSIGTCESPYLPFSAEEKDDPAIIRKELLAGYFGAIASMDENIGRVLDRLEKDGVLKDTIIVFTADNGMNCGQHGIWGKGNGTYPQNMYEESVKIPMIVYAPGTIHGGIVMHNLYSHYDIFTTMIDLLGLQVSEEETKKIGNLPGKSFANDMVNGEPSDSRTVVIYSEYGPVRLIRKNNLKYIQVDHDGNDQLYDLIRDPQERENCIDDPAYAGALEELRCALQSFFTEHSTPEHNAAGAMCYGCGQSDIFESGRNSFVRNAMIDSDYFEYAEKRRK